MTPEPIDPEDIPRKLSELSESERLLVYRFRLDNSFYDHNDMINWGQNIINKIKKRILFDLSNKIEINHKVINLMIVDAIKYFNKMPEEMKTANNNHYILVKGWKRISYFKKYWGEWSIFRNKLMFTADIPITRYGR